MRTAINLSVGKIHVGHIYRNSNGQCRQVLSDGDSIRYRIVRLGVSNRNPIGFEGTMSPKSFAHWAIDDVTEGTAPNYRVD